ncbi:hypothetical protein BKA81DRAFT_20011 [Phyllosticta paracitricarpa]|uniref:Uncharacterized protein n=1 Tax=Phyllosticta paracitricarpa TaxID=2016321 RepID=A0ABR1NIN4_9PEZI
MRRGATGLEHEHHRWMPVSRCPFHECTSAERRSDFGFGLDWRLLPRRASKTSIPRGGKLRTKNTSIGKQCNVQIKTSIIAWPLCARVQTSSRPQSLKKLYRQSQLACGLLCSVSWPRMTVSGAPSEDMLAGVRLLVAASTRLPRVWGCLGIGLRWAAVEPPGLKGDGSKTRRSGRQRAARQTPERGRRWSTTTSTFFRARKRPCINRERAEVSET